MKILIDCGHSCETPGKRSPDGKFFEWAWCKKIGRRLRQKLVNNNYDTDIINEEDTEVSLTKRYERCNAFCKKYGSKNCMFISIHVNAAGNGKTWNRATGWSVFVSPKASTSSKALANLLYDKALAHGVPTRRPSPKQKYWIGNFTVLNKTNCRAVLVENMFQDNKKDVEYLSSEEGQNALMSVLYDAIVEISCK